MGTAPEIKAVSMSLFTFKRRAASLSQAGQAARRNRTQALAPVAPQRSRGGWSSLLRLTPLSSDAAQGGGSWPSLALGRLGRAPSAAPAFLCTDFAPSQWLTKR